MKQYDRRGGVAGSASRRALRRTCSLYPPERGEVI
jgi:hypothetical protein